jgi:drug/metabolite transporter (DMT)-like permease
MTWFFFTISAAFCWGTAQVLIKKGFDHLPPLWNNIFNNGLSLFIWGVPILFFKGGPLALPPSGILVTIFGAAALYQLYFYSISRGQITLTGTLVAGYPVVTIALSHFFLAERLYPLQYAGVALILAGSVVVALPEKNGRVRTHDISWIFWGMACSVTIGAGDFLSKLSIDAIGPFSHMLFLAFISNAASLFNYTIDRKNRYVPRIFSRKLGISVVGLMVNLAGTFLFYMAFYHGKASLVIGVSSIYPLFMVTLALRLLNEVITVRQGAGIGSILGGLLLVGLGS